MKYVLMFTSHPELDALLPAEQAESDLQRILAWHEDNRAVIIDGGAALHPVETATTVRAGDGDPVVVDGPFSEAKEVIGGFTLVDVPDLDAAIALAKQWPSLDHPGNSVEIRPMFDDEELFAG
ncbi:YciI family protein [Microbacterium sp. p3-SID336]|uniref:YciI family protein n=1 Tax=Microbacterium sp. p3-SID336 TaxID=2916212 RepID=UPI0021A8C503|nr:YciI family protein [Microbacterium sp. p3-SID336]MCT1477275.1 YciI family protein [Microbacterium sp. p3-SID336]